MKRAVLTLFLVFCVATLIAEGAAVMWLITRGHLNADSVRDIRMILQGEDPHAIPLPSETEKAQVSGQEVMKERVTRLFEIEARNREIEILKGMISAQAATLTAEQVKFEKKKKDFEEELRQMNARLVADSIEQTRGVLMAMPAQAAVRQLVDLPLEQNIVLLKGMPEKTIARLLQEFQGDDKQIERGKKILEALSAGAPGKKIVDSALDSSAGSIKPEPTDRRTAVKANEPLSVGQPTPMPMP